MNDNIYLKRLNFLSKTNEVNFKNIPKNDLNVLNFIFKKGSGFAINECFKIDEDVFYNLVTIINAKDFDDLVFIISILNSNYFSFDLVEKTLKNKKHFLFASEEELLTYLLDKEISLESSNRIIADLGHLFEWEILLLESSDMNEDEIEVIKNIKLLSKETASLNEASYIYLLAYFKYYYPNQFSNCLWHFKLN